MFDPYKFIYGDTKPHLIMVGGRVLEFKSAGVGREWSSKWRHIPGAIVTSLPWHTTARSFREWKERKVENNRYAVKVNEVRRANDALARNRLIDWIFKDFFSCAK